MTQMAEQLYLYIGRIDERALVNTDTRKATIEIGVALLEALCKNFVKIITIASYSYGSW